MTTVEIIASPNTLDEDKFPIEIEVPEEIAETKDGEELTKFINDYLDENEVEVKEWVLSENKVQEKEQEAEEELDVPF